MEEYTYLNWSEDFWTDELEHRLFTLLGEPSAFEIVAGGKILEAVEEETVEVVEDEIIEAVEDETVEVIEDGINKVVEKDETTEQTGSSSGNTE